MKTQEQINNEKKAFKAIVKANGLTLTELAARIGVTKGALSSMLTRGVSTGLAARTAVALNIDIKELQAPNEGDKATAAPTAKKRLSFPFQCAGCGKIHTITIEIE